MKKKLYKSAQLKRLHTNGNMEGFRPQSQKLEVLHLLGAVILCNMTRDFLGEILRKTYWSAKCLSCKFCTDALSTPLRVSQIFLQNVYQ